MTCRKTSGVRPSCSGTPMKIAKLGRPFARDERAHRSPNMPSYSRSSRCLLQRDGDSGNEHRRLHEHNVFYYLDTIVHHTGAIGFREPRWGRTWCHEARILTEGFFPCFPCRQSRS